MALYRYVKAVPTKAGKPFRVHPFVPLLFITAGVITLIWTLWPIVSFSVFTQSLFTRIVSPLADASPSRESGQTDSTLPVVLAAGSSEEQSPDFTNANVWFPTLPQKKVVTPVNSYTLSIPKLKITDASVIIAGDDLGKSLIHYGGTGLPGEYGNAVIFGHSVLPQFYNPKDYTTIFSTLPTLKLGDDVFVAYDEVTYRYTVEEMVVRDANDLEGLEQRFDDSYITLVTCVPPGTYWKRLYVLARIVKPDAHTPL